MGSRGQRRPATRHDQPVHRKSGALIAGDRRWPEDEALEAYILAQRKGTPPNYGKH